MLIEQIKQGSTAYLTYSPRDKNGDPDTPLSLTYRIDDLTSGTEILADTALTPGSSVEIVLPPSVNVTVGNKRVQHRRVTVQATYGPDDGVNDEYEYQLINLGGVA